MEAELQAQDLKLDSLLLDPNNYRLQDNDTFQSIAPERFHLERVQKGTFDRLLREGVKVLRDSIASNGFLPIERIVVVPYEHQDGKYLVIEGNRRVAALRQLSSEYEAGIELSPGVVAVFEAVPCIVVEENGEVAFFKETLMGVRHVGGIQEWGGFQRAKLIADLRDTHGVDLSDVAQRLGLTPNEVNRRYRAFKALEQMQGDDEFSDLATAKLYPIFHEAVSVPLVRDWLGWDPATFSFNNAETLENFYRLITPRPATDEGAEKPAKIATYSDVRNLREILVNPDAKADLLDLERGITDALSIARTKEKSRRWRVEVSDANTALVNIGALELNGFTEQDWRLLEELRATTQALLDIRRGD
ncbi:ParB N-terminal domain-containing protein [Shimia sp. R9_3]|uniref:ParB N-terminal domain-containing protein n=1 Tax=Shimia sp. R9_3 TaxID=2821113 RepID=UPI001ADC4468|nr:ParB N-terminal domain-containing protein [Shimia sp. R9_3]MBO9399745.1 hypothetical protein [Shimia sp. R9_3]